MQTAQRFAQIPLMPDIAILLVALAFLFSAVAAQTTASPSTFTWENYKGASQWSVKVIEDDTACGDDQPIITTQDLIIQHDLNHATMGDLGHGPIAGDMAGNILHIAARTVSDPPGTSKLSAYDVTFSPDCMAFTARYKWDYSDEYQQCSGTTSFSATRVGASGCPGPLPPANTTIPPEGPTSEELAAEVTALHPDLEQAKSLNADLKKLENSMAADRAAGREIDPEFDPRPAQAKADSDKMEELQSSLQAKYSEILKTDPKNFWANWDMAELRKTQGDNAAYFNYLDNAVDANWNVFQSTHEALQSQAMQDLHLSKLPDKTASAVDKRLLGETDGWSSGSINDIMVKKPDDTPVWHVIFPTSISQKVSDLFYTVAGIKNSNSNQ